MMLLVNFNVILYRLLFFRVFLLAFGPKICYSGERMSKIPKKIQKEMALVYEKCWNEVVSEYPQWKKKAIIEGFSVIDGHHIYESRREKEIASEAAHEASKRADAIIYELYTGKY